MTIECACGQTDCRYEATHAREYAALTSINEPIFGSKQVGSRFATKVRVTTHGAFAGARGYVVTAQHRPGSIMVRLTNTRWRGVTLPFGESEIEVTE